MDVRDLKYESNSFDVVIDKSTMDALLCGDTCYSDVAKMLNEVQRVLKIGGYYIVISYGQPENRVTYFKSENLSFEVDYMVLESERNDQQTSCHFIYVAKKKKDADEMSKRHWAAKIERIERQERDDLEMLRSKK